MTAIRKGSAVVAAGRPLAEPPLTSGIMAEIARMNEPGNFKPQGQHVVMRAEDKEAAMALLPVFERLYDRAEPELIEGWLRELGKVMVQVPDKATFQDRLAGVLFALGALPAAVWSPDNLRLAMSTFRFFPAISELSDLLVPQAESLGLKVRALRRLAEASVHVPPKPVSPENERAYAVAQGTARAATEAARAPAVDEQDNVTPLRKRPLAPVGALPTIPAVRPMSQSMAEVVRRGREQLKGRSSGAALPVLDEANVDPRLRSDDI